MPHCPSTWRDRFHPAARSVVNDLRAVVFSAVLNPADRHFGWLFSLLVSSGVAFFAPPLRGVEHLPNTPTLEQIQSLIAVGATELALQSLETGQHTLDSGSELWMRWERQRIDLYARRGHWRAVQRRVEQLPADLPRAFRDEMHTRQADAYLQQGNGAVARALLRRLIWRPEGGDADMLAQWRRLVVSSYVVDGRVDDAHSAMLRYLQDYGQEGREEWVELRARVLMLAGRDADAAQVLAQAPTARSEPLRLLAALRSRAQAPPQIIDSARKALQRKTQPELASQLWYVIAEAARRGADSVLLIQALEQSLAIRAENRAGGDVFALSSDQLWDAYASYAREVGNARQLLLGDDDSWFDSARTTAEQAPVEARAIFALLGLRARSVEQRHVAHRQFAQLLQREPNGLAVVHRLYLASQHFPAVGQVPASIRYLLVGKALAESDIALASELMRDLEQAPAGTDAFMWALRRARVFVTAGRFQAATGALHELLADGALDSRERTDRFIQVIFDLQAAGEHTSALRLFAGMLEVGLPRQLEREVRFWMADSNKALGQHADAAALYIHSAAVGDPSGYDLWAQAALYKAAEALVEGGLVADARRLYRDLLARSQDDAQRGVLKRKLQQLELVPTRTSAAK